MNGSGEGAAEQRVGADEVRARSGRSASPRPSQLNAVFAGQKEQARSLMRERMKRQQLIGRYEHNYFRGWVVAAKRRGRRWVKYFSDKPDGRAAALRKARAFRDELVAQLPAPTKVKRSYALNTTGEVGVARTKERTRSGGILCRYVASLPRRRPRKASFSVGLYGEQQAFKLAVEARRRRLAELGIRNHP